MCIIPNISAIAFYQINSYSAYRLIEFPIIDMDYFKYPRNYNENLIQFNEQENKYQYFYKGFKLLPVKSSVCITICWFFYLMFSKNLLWIYYKYK